jgi:hypothetical protein
LRRQREKSSRYVWPLTFISPLAVVDYAPALLKHTYTAPLRSTSTLAIDAQSLRLTAEPPVHGQRIQHLGFW